VNTDQLIINKAIITPEVHERVLVASKYEFKKVEAKQERDVRFSNRSRIAQQGLLTRTGIPRLPAKPVYVKYTSNV
jgi:hypothetical protein